MFNLFIGVKKDVKNMNIHFLSIYACHQFKLFMILIVVGEEVSRSSCRATGTGTTYKYTAKYHGNGHRMYSWIGLHSTSVKSTPGTEVYVDSSRLHYFFTTEIAIFIDYGGSS